jgi:LPXTG-motif cell wall-anchored protein
VAGAIAVGIVAIVVAIWLSKRRKKKERD